MFVECILDAVEKKRNVKESLEKAKQAVALDVKDGTSWSELLLLDKFWL